MNFASPPFSARSKAEKASRDYHRQTRTYDGYTRLSKPMNNSA